LSSFVLFVHFVFNVLIIGLIVDGIRAASRAANLGWRCNNRRPHRVASRKRPFMSKSHLATSLIVGFLLLTLAYADLTTVTNSKNLIPAGSSLSSNADAKLPADFTLAGDATYGVLGDERDRNGRGIRFLPANDLDNDGQHAGSVITTVRNITANAGRWFRFRIRGLAQDNFKVEKDDLYLP